MRYVTEYVQLKLGKIRVIFPNFQKCACCQKLLKNNKQNSLNLAENMFEYLAFGISCSSKLAVLLELRFRKTVRFPEHIMYLYRYLRIWRQLEGFVFKYIPFLLPFFSLLDQKIERTAVLSILIFFNTCSCLFRFELSCDIYVFYQDQASCH